MHPLNRPRTQTKSPRIALFGAFGLGNLGNECTLQALIHNIRAYVPNAEISCICPGPDEVQSSYKIPASPIKEIPLSPVKNRVLRSIRRLVVGIPLELIRWIKAAMRVRNLDALIMTGTGMLGDFGISPFDLHYEILKWTVVAKLCRCKVLFVSVGAGPIHHRLSRHFVKAALSCADYRSYRDTFSKDYLSHIGFSSERDYVYPDLAYSFPKRMATSSSDEDSHNGTTVIGLGLMTYFNRRSTFPNDETIYRGYIAKLGDFVAWLIEKNYTVRLLIGDVTYDERARKDLREAIARRIPSANGRLIDTPAASVDDVFSQLAATDLVVASRFHNILLALMLGKPTLAISYHQKIDSLMAEAGLPEFCQDIESLDLQQICRQFAELESSSKSTTLHLQRNAEACRLALDEQYRRLFSTYVV